MRFAGLFSRPRRDGELAAELESHLEMHIEDNIRAGMTPEEARRQALIKLGGVEQTKENYRERRGIPWLESLWQDVRFGLRMLRKNPGFTAVAVLTLALGIGASTTAFSIYYNLTFNAFTAKNADRLSVPVIANTDTAGSGFTEQLLACSSTNFDAIRPVFEDIVCFRHANMLLSDGRHTRQLDGAYVTANAFDFYGVPPLLGRGITSNDDAADAPPVFVMSYKTWKREFNSDPGILNESFTVDDEPRTLVGIMPARFQGYGALVGMWMPESVRDTSSPHRGGLQLILGRLKPGVSLGEASANLRVVMRNLAKDQPSSVPEHFTARVETASDFLMGPYGIGRAFGTAFSAKHMIYVLLCGVLMLLLIACSNVANLLLARATVREKEIAIRSALGASRGRLIRQLLAESSLLAAVACGVGCLVAYFGLRGANAIIPRSATNLFAVVGGEVVFGLNLPVLCFALTITVLTTLICGLAPAIRSVGKNLQPGLAGVGKEARSGSRHGGIRAALVISEVALSIVLLAVAGLIIHSVFLLTHVDLGYHPKNVLLVSSTPRSILQVPVAQRQYLVTAQNEKFIQALKNVPGVEDVAVDDTIAGYGGGRGSDVSAPGNSRSSHAGVDGCDERLLSTLGMDLVSGSWFSKADLDSARQITVINQTMANRLWGDTSPIGQQLEVKSFQMKDQRPHDEYFQVAGVVRDLKNVGPAQPALPEAFIPYTIQRSGIAILLKTASDADSLLHPIEERVWAIDPDATFVYAESLEDFLDMLSYSTPKFGAMAIAPVAGIALLLVMSGIFSVMAYTVSLQTREIGIRMALGAQQCDVSRMVLRKGFGLVAAGLAIGLCASAALTRFLASQIWGVSPTDPWTFGTVIALIVVVGLAASYIPARRAMRVDPMVALRHE